MTGTATTPNADGRTTPISAVPDLLLARAAGSPGSPALLFDTGEPLTFGDWELGSRRVANALAAAGISRGDRVALLFRAGEWVNYAIAYLGTLRACATALHLNDRVPDDEVRRRFELCGVTAVLHSSGATPPAWFTDRTISFDETQRGGDEPLTEAPDPAAPSDILFTSGTTGTAKAYVVPHGNLTFGREPSTLRDFQGGGYMLVPMTLGTSSSATCVLAALTAPAISVMCDPDDVERMGELIQRSGSPSK